MSALAAWIDGLAAAAREAEGAEARYRADFARRVAELAEERAVAHRRANLLRAVAGAVSAEADEPAAVAHGLAAVRDRLGWSSDSEARAEILERFAPVCAAAFQTFSQAPENSCGSLPGEEGPDGAPDPAAALAEFEAWYRGARGTPFWLLFENAMPETPRVDW